MPDEPVNLGFLEIASPFDRTKTLWIGIEMALNSLYSTGFYLRLLTREYVVGRVIQDEFERRKTHLLASIEKEFVENGYDVPYVRQVGDVKSCCSLEYKLSSLFQQYDRYSSCFF